jgi:hypothetical protein
MSDGMTLASEHAICGRGRGAGIDVWRRLIDVRDGASRLNGGKPGVVQWAYGSTGQRACVEFHTISFGLFIIHLRTMRLAHIRQRPRRSPPDRLTAPETAFGCLREIGQPNRLTPSRAIYISGCRNSRIANASQSRSAQWPGKSTLDAPMSCGRMWLVGFG